MALEGMVFGDFAAGGRARRSSGTRSMWCRSLISSARRALRAWRYSETGDVKHAIHLIDLTADHYFGERWSVSGLFFEVLLNLRASHPESSQLAFPEEGYLIGAVFGSGLGGVAVCHESFCLQRSREFDH